MNEDRPTGGIPVGPIAAKGAGLSGRQDVPRDGWRRAAMVCRGSSDRKSALRTSRGRFRAFRTFLLYTLLLSLAAGGGAGCGHVRVQITNPPPNPSPTSPVTLSTRQIRSTSTPVPATPLPTVTATATPTPILHVIARGETILGIASQYNVSTEALIEVNGIENPRTLQIGQTLVIPAGDTTSLLDQPTATSTPMPLQVVNLAMHRTPVGGMWVMGEVQNDRDEHLDHVQLQMSLYNADGELLEKRASFAVADVVLAHGKAPFALLFPHLSPGGFASHEIVILSAEPIARWGNRHQYLVVEQVQGEMTEGTFLAEGTVFNPSQKNARDVRVTLTCYGSDGSVVGVRQIDVGMLAAGEGKAFVLSTIPAAPAVSVQGVAWGMKDTS